MSQPFNFEQFMRDMDVLTGGCTFLEGTYGMPIANLRDLYMTGKYVRGDFLEKTETERATDSIDISNIEANVHRTASRAITRKVIDQGPFGHWHECYHNDNHSADWGVIGYR